MRILLVSQEYPPETARGGIGTQTAMKAKGLSKLGHQIFVLSQSKNGVRNEIVDAGIQILRIPGIDRNIPDMTLPVQWLIYSSHVAAEIERLCKTYEFDLIEFPEYGAEAFVYLLNRTKCNRIPTIIQLHGSLAMLAHNINWPEKNSEFYKVGSFMEATCFRLAEKVYSSSRFSAKWCLDKYFKRQDEIPVIHTGVDTEIFFPKNLDKHPDPTILFVGRLAESKGIINLVEVVCKLSQEFPNIKLHMVGNGDDAIINRLKTIADKFNKPDLLHFMGYLFKEKLADEYSKAHIFAAPSYFEGGPGFVYLEAMACGLPVIGCSGSGIEEIIETGKNGLLVSPTSNVELEEAIRKLLNDPEFSDKIAHAGRNYVLRRADKNICIKKIENLYFEVINQF